MHFRVVAEKKNEFFIIEHDAINQRAFFRVTNHSNTQQFERSISVVTIKGSEPT